MASSNSPCAACKLLRRKCTQECVFAPYFPPDQPQKFAKVHKVFGASNVAKLLNDLDATHREDAVNSLAYEADARLRDPVYGCVGLISILQHKLKQVQEDLSTAKKELATYIGPSALVPYFQQHGFMMQPQNTNPMPYNMIPMLGLQTGPSLNAPLMIRDAQQQQQQHMIEAHQLAAVVAAREHQQMMQNEIVRYNGGGGGGFDQAGPVNPSGFGGAPAPCLALGSFDQSFQVQHQQPEEQQQQQHNQIQLLQPQLLIQQQMEQQQQHQHQPPLQQHQRGDSEEGTGAGPSC